MARAFSPSVVTANDLLSGAVVYLDASGLWTDQHAEAALFTDEAEAKSAETRAAAQSARVVGVYLAEARADAGGPAPTHFREAFRAKGPSNYDHGKQAQV